MMRVGRMLTALLLALVVLVLATAATSRTWDVPFDAPTIQAGLDSASAGDTVVVECGTYYEYGLAMKSGVVLRSETGEAGCVTIDATNVVQHYVIGCVNCDSNTRIEGFTMINGTKQYDAGGVFCHLSDMTFSNCVIANNSCTQRGGGMYIWDCSPTISHCTFYGNSAPWSTGGGGICCNNSFPTIENTIIAFNTDGGAVTCREGGSPTLVCCDVYGNAEGDWADCISGQNGISGNFSEDPLFCEAAAGDFRLEDVSPCLPGLHPYGYDCGSQVGAQSIGCGSATRPTTWSEIKANYRR